MSAQLILRLETAPALGRRDFLVAPGNAEAVAFIDSYPHWPSSAALHGPAGSGKSHLVSAWSQASGAVVVEAAELGLPFVERLEAGVPVAVENVDVVTNPRHEPALFALLNRPEPLVLTGRAPPAQWQVEMPDLASRIGALLSFSLWQPDDALLAALTRKLFTDRQLAVSDAVVMRILRSLERSPSAIRDFVARADARALAEKRPITAVLVGEMLAEDEGGLS